jgi:protocatechuate 3,4-dioxygenase beta subunit
MNVLRLLLVAVLVGVIGPLAAADPTRGPLDEAEARQLIERAAHLVGAERVALGTGPTAARMTSEKSTRDAGALLAEIAAFELALEQGRVRLDPGTRDRLERARRALETEPFHVPMDKSLAKSLTTLSGTVRRASDDATLQGVVIQAIEFTWGSSPSGVGISASTATNASGAYTLTLPPGRYLIRANPSSVPGVVTPAATGGYRRQVYNGIPCEDFNECQNQTGTVVAVNAGSPVSGIDFALAAGGGVSGTVTRAGAGTPVAGVAIQLLNERDGIVASGLTDSSGAYAIVGLPPGNYRVFSFSGVPADRMPELYDDRPCSGEDCRWLPADTVTVAADTVATGINLTLDGNPAFVEGIVRNDLGDPIPFASVALFSEDRYTSVGGRSDATGAFRLGPLRAGTYRLQASGITDDGAVPPAQPITRRSHVPTRWPAVPCPQGCLPDTGTPIAVAAGATVVLPQPLVMARGARVLGQIRSATDLSPIADVTVFVTGDRGGGSARTDASGHYEIGGLSPGSYAVYATASGTGRNFISTYNGGFQCGLNFCGLAGTPVTLTASGPGSSATVNIDMAPGGRITGTIRDAVSGAPITRLRARLELFDPTTGQLVQTASQALCDPPTATTPATCRYEAAGLLPGSYKGVFATTSTSGWIDTAFGGGPCPRGGCDLAPLPPLFATSGGLLTGIDGTLPRGRLIRGRVRESGGTPIDCRPADPEPGLGVCGGLGFNNTLDNYAAFAQADRAGFYASRTGFTPGTTVYASTFLLRNNWTFGWGYVDQAYAGLACPFGSCGITTGTGITVGAAADVTGIDFNLVRGGAITGTVTASAGGAPIGGVEVRVTAANGRLAGRTQSTSDGRYRVSGLSPGTYYVSTSNNQAFRNEVWNNLPCEPFCNPLDGTPVTVTGTAATAGIDFALDAAASISGQVRLGATPQANVPVELYGAVGNLVRTTTTNASGNYTFAGLAAGRFFVRTRDTAGRADALWNGLPCLGSACNVRQGTPIDLAAGASQPGVDLVLTNPATISGTVTRLPGSTPTSGVTIQLLAASGAVALTTTTNASGSYAFTGLPAGTYRLVTRNTPGLIDVAWPSAPCPAACNGLNGSAITVTAGGSATGRNFTLDPGGSISGSVRQASPVAPIPGVTVQVYGSGGIPVAQVLSNASGNYEVGALPTGNFVVRTQQNLGFADQLFNNLPCTGYCDLLSGTPVPVTSGSGTGLVDFSLTGGLSISGRVRDAATGAGIALARVTAFDVGGFIAGSAQADASGNYTIAGLRPGTYRLRTANLSGYVNQIWNGVACTPTPCLIGSGTPVTLSAGNVGGIDFSLTRGGTISGTATDTFNNPLPTATAFLYDANGTEITSAPVANGIWEFSGLANGTYYVLIRNSSGLIDQLWNNIPCPAGACNIAATGTPIVLTGTEPGRAGGKSGPANINLRLPPGQTISGTVTDATTSQPIPGVTVYFFNAAGVEVGQATTNALGQYVSEGGLAAGSYRAATTNGVTRGAADGYVNRLYSGQNCLLACNFAGGTPISVTSTPTTGIDFALSKAGPGMTGTVRDVLGNPLALITIRVFDASGTLAGVARTNSVGVFRLDGLPAGNYFARTVNDFGYQDRLYGGAICGTGCDPLAGTPIAVPATTQVQNIDFTLGFPDPVFANGFEAP